MRELAAQAREIDDPYHAAWAVFRLSRDDPALRRSAMELLERVEPSWRQAELAADVVPYVQDDPETVLALARRIVLLPAGKARSHALHETVKRAPPASLPELLAAAVQDPETGIDDTKTILRAWSRNPVADVQGVLDQSDPETRARLYGYLHLQNVKAGKPIVTEAFAKAIDAAGQAPDRPALLRYLATVAQSLDELEILLELEKEDEPRARLLLKAVAQADRLHKPDQARLYLERAESSIQALPDERTRRKLRVNLQKATNRLQTTKTKEKPAPGATKTKTPSLHPTKTPGVTLPEVRGQRPVLALHNGYTGKLGTPHLRAVARAAPLCAAFGLDLMLIGFPVKDADALVEQAEADTRIGEGAAYARALLVANRVHWSPRGDHTNPKRWSVTGPIVATTPHPEPGKTTALDRLGPSPVVVIGLGPQGLPNALLKKADHHLEITGHGVSLETATAMGVIAQRLNELHAA